MKKYVIFLFFLLCPVTIYAKTSIGLGDSITTGYGVEKGYFEQICEEKRKIDSKHHCENLAVDGMTSTELLLLLEDEKVIQKIKEADFIYMSIGGNDFLGDISKNFTVYLTGGVGTAKETGESLLKNMRLIYERIHSIHKSTVLYVVPLYNPYFEILSKNKGVLSIFDSVKKEYSALADEFSYVHISPTLGKELESSTYLNASLTNIDPHPNTLGHNLIAQKIERQVEDSTKKKDFKGFYIGIGGLVLLFLFVITGKIFRRK